MYYGIMEYGAIGGKTFGSVSTDYISNLWVPRANNFILAPARTQIEAQGFSQSVAKLVTTDTVITSETWDLTLGFQSVDFIDFQYAINNFAALATGRNIVSQSIVIASSVTIAGLSSPGLNYPVQVTVQNSTGVSQQLVQADAAGTPAAGGFELAALGVLGFNAAEVGKTATLTYETTTASTLTIGGTTPLAEIGPLTFFGKMKGTRGDVEMVIPQANFSASSSTPITISGAVVEYTLVYRCIAPSGWSLPFQMRQL